MADNDYDFVDPGTTDDGSELVKHLRKTISDREKELRDRNGELKALREEHRQTRLKTLLADVPDRFHRLAEKEIEEVTPESVAQFVKDYGDLWGHVEEELDEVEVDTRDQMDRVSRASQSGTKPKGFESASDNDLLNMNKAEFDKYLKGLNVQ